MAQFTGSAHWAEPSLLFAHKARPTPLKCKNEYLVLALGEETAVLAIFGFIAWELLMNVMAERECRLGVW